jgi:sugar lactone lactonase YvrE
MSRSKLLFSGAALIATLSGAAVFAQPAQAPAAQAQGAGGSGRGFRPCPPPGAPETEVVGNITSLDPVQNADTDLPANSPLAGLPNPYRLEFDWAKMPAGRIWGDARAIAMDRDGKSIWLLDRCGLAEDACSKPKAKDINPIMHFAADGTLLKSFGAGLFSDSHGITVDRDGNVWTVDGTARCAVAGAPAGDKLRKWSPDGRLLMTISGPQGGKPFTGLTDVVISPVTGEIFLGDGHGRPANDRIMKFDRNGKYLMEWGTPGNAPEQIGIPHGLAMDKEGRIYVADRTNKVVKVFDQNGKLLHVWDQFGAPAGVFVDKNDRLYVADETANSPNNPKFSPGVRIATTDGKIIANVPYRPGNALEGVTVDDAGNIYGANTNHPRSVRWIRTGPL